MASATPGDQPGTVTATDVMRALSNSALPVQVTIDGRPHRILGVRHTAAVFEIIAEPATSHWRPATSALSQPETPEAAAWRAEERRLLAVGVAVHQATAHLGTRT